MPEISYAIDLGGIAQLTDTIESRIRDFTPLWEGAVDSLARGWMEEQWETEGAAGGNPWVSLSPVTLDLKGRENRRDMGILSHSGALMRSMRNRSDPFELRESTKTEYRKGTRVESNGFPYALAHQTGWTMHSFFGRPVPPRSVRPRYIVPPVLPDAWINALQDVVVRYLEEGAA
jgi:hypothetical protein